MGMKYRQGLPGDRWVVPFNGIRLVACCDCGLVHKHVFSVEPHPKFKGKGVIVQHTYDAKRETAQIRRAMVSRGDLMEERGSNIYIKLMRIRANRKPGRVNVKYEPDND